MSSAAVLRIGDSLTGAVWRAAKASVLKCRFPASEAIFVGQDPAALLLDDITGALGVPETTTLALTGLGLLAMGLLRRRPWPVTSATGRRGNAAKSHDPVRAVRPDAEGDDS